MRPATIFCVLFLSTLGLAAQQPADTSSPLGVVERLFDAMRQRDTAGMRALLHPSVRLVSVFQRGGVRQLEEASVEEWLSAVARAAREPDERIWDPRVESDDPLATVWVKYELLIGGEFSHCGVDAFQLFRSPEGWRIFHVADTRRRDNCWHRPA